jgi:hypothetical protein
MCDADEYCDVQVESEHVARKSHRCCACGEAIEPGQRYHRTFTVFDGVTEVFKHCARCWVMLVAISRRTREPVDFKLNCGEVWEDPPPEVEALAFALPGDSSTKEALR